MEEATMKQRILDAAVAEIELHGSSFRMDDLAKRLNISKRTLYENFHSKNWAYFIRQESGLL